MYVLSKISDVAPIFSYKDIRKQNQRIYQLLPEASRPGLKQYRKAQSQTNRLMAGLYSQVGDLFNLKNIQAFILKKEMNTFVIMVCHIGKYYNAQGLAHFSICIKVICARIM